MPDRTANGSEWAKMEQILNPEKYPMLYPLFFINQNYMRAYRLLRVETKKISRMTSNGTLHFSDRELDIISDAFDYLARINGGKMNVARSISRFFRTGDLDRRIA